MIALGEVFAEADDSVGFLGLTVECEVAESLDPKTARVRVTLKSDPENPRLFSLIEYNAIVQCSPILSESINDSIAAALAPPVEPVAADAPKLGD